MNYRSGARGRLSGLVASMCLLLIIVFLNTVIEKIPIASLIGVMYSVVIHTFVWSSFPIVWQTIKLYYSERSLHKNSFLIKHGFLVNSLVIIIVTSIPLVADLATAVACGIVFESLWLLFQMKNKLEIDKVKLRTNVCEFSKHSPQGDLFFVAVKKFCNHFVLHEDSDNTIIDLSKVKLLDVSSILALREIVGRYNAEGKLIHFANIDEETISTVELTYGTEDLLRAIRFSMIIPGTWVIRYNEPLKPRPKPFLIEYFINYFRPSSITPSIPFFGKFILHSIDTYDQTIRNSIQIGRVAYDEELGVNCISRWEKVNDFDFGLIEGNAEGIYGLSDLRELDRIFIEVEARLRRKED
jgi:MFS superfamily sulfate permease-like transporter